MATDIIEPLLESMKIVGESILQGLSYDITVPCNIVDASQRNNGEYKVSNGTATFIAYSENTEYREGQTVYVKIPQGDYNNDKIITGRKKDKDSVEPYIYHNPIDTVLDITGNINPDDKQFGLIANDTIENVQVLDLRFSKPYYNFERLAIRAGFRSWLSDLNCVRGDYGLKLEIEFKPQNVDSTASANNYTKTLYLNTSDMIGDVYSFDNFFQQSKVFDISQEAGIIAIKGWFYQDSNFIDASGNKIPYLDEFEQPILSNLFINGIEIILGYNYTNYNQEFVKLFTFNNTIYGPNRPNDQKIVELKWVHIEDNGNRTVMKPEVDGNYEIRWYRYELGSPSDDSYSGVFYKRINPANGEVWSEGAATKSFTCVFTPDSAANEEEKIKAVILFGDEPKIYRSDVLTFTNNSQILNAPTLDAVRAVNLECDDLSYGNYYVYDEGNGLLPNFVKTQERRVICNFNLSATGETHNDFSDLSPTDSIIWKFPNKNTMLIVDESQIFNYSDNRSIVHDDDDGYTTITTNNLDIRTLINNKPTLKYSIKSYYSAAANNNTITCVIKKGGVEYTGLLTFSFGQAGTTGTDYTLVLEFEDNNFNAITLRTTNKFNVRAFLYNQNNELQKLDGTTIDFKWKDSNSKVGYSMSWQKSDDGYSYICEISVNSNASINDILILQTTLSGWGDYNLISYLPIPIKTVTNSYIIGADKVVYSTSGNPSYYKNPYEYYENNKKVNVVWNSKAVDELNDSKFLPSIKVQNNNGINEYRLKPKSLYIDGLKPYAVQAIYNNQAIWTQPILIIQNEYFSSTINKWDGALTIDENESYILSKMIGAGKKNSENKFTGVLMGDWQGKVNVDDLALTNYTGLFGFQNGVMTYAFKDDGTGFIGSETNRIDFNNSNNFISTSIFSLSKKSPYFTIKNASKKELLNVGDNSYYLRSANYEYAEYDESATKGTFIDLQNGQMIINSGVFNKDISIPYGRKRKKLLDILDELYNTADDANSLINKTNKNVTKLQTFFDRYFVFYDTETLAPFNSNYMAILDGSKWFSDNISSTVKNNIINNAPEWVDPDSCVPIIKLTPSQVVLGINQNNYISISRLGGVEIKGYLAEGSISISANDVDMGEAWAGKTLAQVINSIGDNYDTLAARVSKLEKFHNI